jgi:putative DNA primase/helicase
MVALVTRGKDDKPMGILRTFLTADGKEKAWCLPNKMVLGPCSGGAVRLTEASDSVMVGEGIETCFSAMQATGRPTWAALSTSGLRSLDLPQHIRDVIILADGDDPGEKAAKHAASRWVREGYRVRIARPLRDLDFNDILSGRARRDGAA